MQQQHVRKAFTYTLSPTPAPQQTLERVVAWCRTLYNTALDERKTAWERRGVSISYYQQQAELPDLKVAFPQYAEVHSQILPLEARRPRPLGLGMNGPPRCRFLASV